MGAKEAANSYKTIGFNKSEKDDNEKVKSILDKELKKKFAPEFLNRLDSIIYFNTLTDDNLKKIVKLELDKSMKRFFKYSITLLLLALIACALLLFSRGISNLENGKEKEDKRQLEEIITRAVVSCYSIEGAYPNSVEYVIEHYGIQYNKDDYIIQYEFYASNLMPEITVLERAHEE